jgi:hypothetical protein
MQVIQAAIKEHTPSVTLLGKVIDVNFNAGGCRGGGYSVHADTVL